MISYVGGDSSYANNGTSISVTFPTGIEADDFAIVICSVRSNSGNFSNSDGFTRLQNSSAVRPTTALFYKKLDGTESGDTTFTSGKNTRHFGAMTVYRGVDPSTPFDTPFSDALHYKFKYNDATPLPKSIETFSKDSLVWIGYGATSDSVAEVDMYPPTGFTMREYRGWPGNNNGWGATADMQVPSPQYNFLTEWLNDPYDNSCETGNYTLALRATVVKKKGLQMML